MLNQGRFGNCCAHAFGTCIVRSTLYKYGVAIDIDPVVTMMTDKLDLYQGGEFRSVPDMWNERLADDSSFMDKCKNYRYKLRLDNARVFLDIKDARAEARRIEGVLCMVACIKVTQSRRLPDGTVEESLNLHAVAVDKAYKDSAMRGVNSWGANTPLMEVNADNFESAIVFEPVILTKIGGAGNVCATPALTRGYREMSTPLASAARPTPSGRVFTRLSRRNFIVKSMRQYVHTKDYAAIVTMMRDNSRANDVQVLGCKAMCEIVLSAASATSMKDAGGVEVVTVLLRRRLGRRSQKDVELAFWVCQALSCLSADTDAAQVIASANTMKALVSIARALNASPGMIDGVCRVLRSVLIRFRKTPRLFRKALRNIVSVGGIDVLMSGLRNPNPKRCSALCALAHLTNPNFCTVKRTIAAIVRNGGVQDVIAVLQSSVRSYNMAAYCCWILKNIAACEQDPAFRNQIVAAGGVDAVVAALQAHGKESPRAAQIGCSVLATLASYTGVLPVMQSTPAEFSMLIKSLAAEHPSNNKLVQSCTFISDVVQLQTPAASRARRRAPSAAAAVSQPQRKRSRRE